MLTILKDLPKNKHGQSVVLVQCSCGAPPSPKLKSLVVTGKVASCGKCTLYNTRPGDVFGWLTVLELSDKQDESGRYQAVCQCGCGSPPRLVPVTYLKGGRVTTCGNCLKPHPDFDLSGKTFGSLRVLHPTRKSRGWKYLVQCQCGSEPYEVTGGSLSAGTVRSCGKCEILQPGDNFHGMVVVAFAGVNTFGKRLYIFRCPHCGKETEPLIGSQVVTKRTNSCGCQRGKQAKENNRKARIQKGGDPEVPLTPAQQLLHLEAADIKRRVMEVRDNFTCQLCGKRGVTLEVHHVFPIADYEELSCDERYLITLCARRNGRESCHSKAHAGNTRGPVDPEVQQVLLGILKRKYSQVV